MRATDDAAAATFKLPGFSDQPQPFTVAAHAAACPAGRRGVLFDLDYATRMAERSASLADNATLRYEVGGAAPADLGRPASPRPGCRRRAPETIEGMSPGSARCPWPGCGCTCFAGAAALLLARRGAAHGVRGGPGPALRGRAEGRGVGPGSCAGRCSGSTGALSAAVVVGLSGLAARGDAPGDPARHRRGELGRGGSAWALPVAVAVCGGPHGEVLMVLRSITCRARRSGA